MAVYDYESLRPHIGHQIVCVGYGPREDDVPWNVAIECITCAEVLLDYDHPDLIEAEEAA